MNLRVCDCFFTLYIGVAGPPPVLDLANEKKGLPSMSDMFEVVAEDLLTLNKNLQSVSFFKLYLVINELNVSIIFLRGGKID